MNRILLLFIALLYSCSPTTEKITIHKYFKCQGMDNEDSTIFIHLEVNTYKDFFKGRESIFSFKRDYYYINLPRIDSNFNESEIKISRYSGYFKDTIFYPKYGRIKINELEKNCINLTIEFKDALLPEILNGKYKLFYQGIDSGRSKWQIWNCVIYNTK